MRKPGVSSPISSYCYFTEVFRHLGGSVRQREPPAVPSLRGPGRSPAAGMDKGGHRVHYRRRPFRREPDFGVTKVDYSFSNLLERAGEPS